MGAHAETEQQAYPYHRGRDEGHDEPGPQRHYDEGHDEAESAAEPVSVDSSEDSDVAFLLLFDKPFHLILSKWIHSFPFILLFSWNG